MRLHVELSGQFVGELNGDERRFDFTPARAANPLANSGVQGKTSLAGVCVS